MRRPLPRHRAALRRAALVAVIAAVVSAGACGGGGDAAPTTTEDATGATTDSSGPTATAGDPTLSETMIRVEGTASSGHLDAATDGDVNGPFRMQVPSAGGGNGAVFNPVSIDGTAGSIVWDGGRPLTLDGPALHFDGGFVVADGSIVFDLASSVVPLVPGAYSVVGPVAVGDASGLARPADAVSFVAGPDAGILGTGASSMVLDGTTTLLGPGSFDLVGSFTVVTRTGSTTATSIHLEDGSFQIEMTPAGDGTVAVRGLADGAGWA